MSQLAYNNKSAIAFDGLIADLEDSEIVSRANGEASAAISFGRAVARSSDSEVVLPTATGNHIVGVSVHSHAHDNRASAGATPTGVNPNDMVSVMRQGVVWVTPEDAVVEGGAVYVRHAAGTLGRFRGADDGANASLLANARWRTSAGAGELAMLELRGSLGTMT